VSAAVKLSDLPILPTGVLVDTYLLGLKDGDTYRVPSSEFQSSAVGGFVPAAVGDGVANDITALQNAINAAAVVGGFVRLEPSKTYLILGTLLISSRVAIEGPRSAVIKVGAVNQSAIRIAAGASGVLLRGFVIDQHADGLGGAVTGNAGGHGVAIGAASSVEISGLAFRNVGIPRPSSVHGNYASPICATGVDALTVEKCDFEASCHNRTGADVLVTGRNISIQNANRSRSECDAFVSLGAGGTNVRHIVAGNFAERAASSIARSGVLYQYDGTSPAVVTIGHNDLEGFVWHGVYGTAQASTQAGAVIVAHNHIRFCGGAAADLDAGTGAWPGAGIRPGGLGGATLIGNIIDYSGYTSALVARLNTAAGILVHAGSANTTGNITGYGNIIKHSSAAPISIAAAGGTVSGVEFSGGVLDLNDGHGVEVSAATASSECITDVTIRGITIFVSAASASAVALTAANGGWANRIHFVGNNCVHTNPGVSAAAGIARVGYSDYTRFTGSVVGNDIDGFATGVGIPATCNLYCPRAVYVADNHIENCVLGMGLGGGSLYWAVHVNTTGTATTSMSPSRSRPGKILGSLTTGTVRVRMLLAGASGGGSPALTPLDGTWEVGDEVELQTPFGPVIGYRCVTAGTPGVWEPVHGARRRHVATAMARFGASAPDSVGIEAPTVTGTATAATWADTSQFTRTTRLTVEETTPSTSAVAGIRSTVASYTRRVGFYVRIRWAPHLGQTIATGRAFVGLSASTSAPTDVDPSTLLNIVGMGWDDDDTNIQFLRNDGSGAAVKTDLGASFPVPSADNANVYQLEVFVPPSGSNLFFRIENVTTGAWFQGGANTDLPNEATQLVGYYGYTSVGGTSWTTGLSFCEFEGQRAA
jgi:hypothetical protein